MSQTQKLRHILTDICNAKTEKKEKKCNRFHPSKNAKKDLVMTLCKCNFKEMQWRKVALRNNEKTRTQVSRSA